MEIMGVPQPQTVSQLPNPNIPSPSAFNQWSFPQRTGSALESAAAPVSSTPAQSTTVATVSRKNPSADEEDHNGVEGSEEDSGDYSEGDGQDLAVVASNAAGTVVTTDTTGRYVDITHLLNMPQSQAARKLNIPTSTLSKRYTIHRRLIQQFLILL